MTGPVDLRVAVTGGVDLAVRASAEGDGVGVVLVHGLASNSRLWDGVAGALAAAGHPVAAVDQRGHGRSDKPQDGYDFATLTSDLVAVIDTLGWERPLVAGQSWGANVVLELAVRYPGATRAVAWVDGGTIELAGRFPTWEAARRALTPPRLAGTPLAVFEALVRSSHPDWPESGVQGTLANVEVRADGTIAPWLSLGNHLTILRHLWEHHPSERYGDVGVPVLILPAGDGQGDEVARARAGLAVVRIHPMPGADHDIHAQRPVALAGLLHAAAGAAPSWWA